MYDIAILLCLIVRGSFSDFWILRGQNLNFEEIFLEENDAGGGGGLFQGGLFRTRIFIIRKDIHTYIDTYIRGHVCMHACIHTYIYKQTTIININIRAGLKACFFFV